MVYLPTAAMGLAFPAVCQALVESGSAFGRKSGFYYLVGNLGAAAGVGVTSLMIVPGIGLVATLGSLCATSIAIGSLAMHYSKADTRRVAWLAIAGAGFLGSIGYACYGPPHIRYGHLQRSPPWWTYQPFSLTWHQASRALKADILRYKAGPSATVIVKDVVPIGGASPYRGIYIDDLHVASSRTYSVIDQKMLTHIPLMLHRNPRSALTVGFGSGGTSWSMTTHGVEVYAVEIEPEVIRSASFFRRQNHGVLDAKNFNLILNDARNHLLVTDRKYDVISTDVTNLQYRQNSSLYTLEYFELMKSGLTHEGVACAWIPMRAIDEQEFKILLRTFRRAFPHATLWYMDHSITKFGILIGTQSSIVFDMERIRAMAENQSIRDDLSEIMIEDPMQIPLFMYLDETGYAAYVGEGKVHTDNRPYLEFTSPVSFYNLGLANDFGNWLERIGEFRPKDYSLHLVNASDKERDRFARLQRRHLLWAAALRLFYFKKNVERDSTEFREKMTSSLESVLEADPNFTPARDLLEHIQP